MPLFLLSIWKNPTLRYLIIGLLVLITVYLLARASGKRKALKDLNIKPLPDNGNGIPIGWDPLPLANEIFTKLDGVFTWAADKETSFAKAMELTNDQLVALYNSFNRNFGGPKGSLTKWLRDEFNVSVGGVRNQLVSKLVNLKCL